MEESENVESGEMGGMSFSFPVLFPEGDLFVQAGT